MQAALVLFAMTNPAIPISHSGIEFRVEPRANDTIVLTTINRSPDSIKLLLWTWAYEVEARDSRGAKVSDMDSYLKTVNLRAVTLTDLRVLRSTDGCSVELRAYGPTGPQSLRPGLTYSVRFRGYPHLPPELANEKLLSLSRGQILGSFAIVKP